MARFVAGLNSDDPFFSSGPYVVGFRQGYFGGSDWAKQWIEDRGRAVLAFDGVRVLKVDKDDARIVLSSHWKMPLFRSQTMEEEFTLARQKNINNPEDKIWCIVPENTKPELKDGVSLRRVAAALAAPAADVSEVRAQKSLTNLKQLALGVLQFVQDYDLVVAFYPEYVQEALIPYVVSNRDPARDRKIKELFTVPGRNEFYAFNENLCDKPFNKIQNPVQTVLFYEGSDGNPQFRYQGKAAICFADGHVTLVSKEDAAKLRWTP